MMVRGEKLINKLTGNRFGRLVVQEVLPIAKGDRRRCRCLCDCGTEKEIICNSLLRGLSLSCGCRTREHIAALNLSHGMTKTPTHNIWSGILKRCYCESDPNYLKYGARGIVVCDRWRESFQNFYDDMGERPSKLHSIDRIKNHLGYEPGNCRWATAREQAENRKSSIMVTINEETHCLKHWCREYGVPYLRTYKRMRRGMTAMEALST